MQWTKEKGQTIIYKISFYPDKTLSRKIQQHEPHKQIIKTTGTYVNALVMHFWTIFPHWIFVYCQCITLFKITREYTIRPRKKYLCFC